MLDIIASYHCIQFQGNLMNQPWENGQKPSFGPNFGPTLDPQNFFVGFMHFMHCCKLTLYAISSKTNEPNLTNWQKTYFRAQFWPLRPKFKPQIFFRGFHPYQMLDIVAYKLSLNAISKKNNKPNKENGKKTSFGSNFGAFGPNSGRQFFFFFFFLQKSGSVNH